MKKTLLTTTYLLFALYILNAQPANDDCINASFISEVSDTIFTTINTTTDGPFHPDSPCPSNVISPDQDSIYNDIWYWYVPSFNGKARWTMCNTADFDTKIAIYEENSNCPPVDSNLITCNEDFGTCENATSELIWDVMVGDTFLLRLGGYGEVSPGLEGSGTFTIEEFVPAVPNDLCADALVVIEGENQAFTSVNAITDGPDHPNNSTCFGFNDPTAGSDIWYLFTPTFTGTAEWNVCGTASFDTRLAVYGPNVECTPGDEDLYACNDDGSGCGSYTSQLFFDVEEDSTYLLRLGGFNNGFGTGTFDLINNNPPPPPANNECSTAEFIEVQGPNGTFTTFGTTSNATFDANTFIFPSCLGNQAGGEFAEVWYSFNSMGFEEIVMQFGIITPDGSFFIDIWDDCGTPLDTMDVTDVCFFAAEATTPLLLDTIKTLAPVPKDYFMRVLTRTTSDTPGDFFIILTGELPSSVEDDLAIPSLGFFPNPLQGDEGQLNVVLSEADPITIQIQDMLGRIVYQEYQKHPVSGINKIPILLPDINSGLYILTINQNENKKSIKILK